MSITSCSRLGWLVAAALTTAGCTSLGPVTNPVARSLSWFSYVAGEDLQEVCPRAGRDLYRFVYNAVYTEQVRTYDITADPAGGEALVEARVFGGPIVGARLALSDPLADWRGRSSRRVAGPDAVAALRGALRAGGFYGPAPVGTRLDSGNFYWVVSACEAGRFRFNAYAAPSRRFAELGFLDVLLRLDDTGVSPNLARPRVESGDDRPGRPATAAAASGGPRFTLEVGRDSIGDGGLF